MRTPEAVAAALGAAGFAVDAADVHFEPRDGRRLVRFPGHRLAWLADTGDARADLACERRVLRLLETRCRFRAPRVLYEAPDGAFDVRAMVEGDVDPFVVFRRVIGEPPLARRLGADVGAILAEQHTRVVAADVAGWLRTTPRWPLPTDVLRTRLPAAVEDVSLRARIEAVLARRDDLTVVDADRVLIHTDVGFHNLALDPETFAVRGIFDYAGAAWADRHHDFRYLVFDRERDEMLDGAIDVYSARTGVAIQRDRVLLYNAMCAVSYLVDRIGTPPDERPCGRTLAEDLAWTAHAVGRVV